VEHKEGDVLGGGDGRVAAHVGWHHRWRVQVGIMSEYRTLLRMRNQAKAKWRFYGPDSPRSQELLRQILVLTERIDHVRNAEKQQGGRK
jgi:hypothetical protein